MPYRFLMLLLALICIAQSGNAQCTSTTNTPTDDDETVNALGPIAVDVLANSFDGLGQALTVTVTASTCPGNTTLSSGVVVVDPQPIFTTNCSVSYDVTNEDNLSASSTLTIFAMTEIFSDGFETGSTSAWSPGS